MTDPSTAPGTSGDEARTADGPSSLSTGSWTRPEAVSLNRLPMSTFLRDDADVLSAIEAKLQSDHGIDAVVTLGAPFAATAAEAKRQAGSTAEIDTFDLNAQVAAALQAGTIGFAVDQQPYLQGYEAIDLLWLYRYNNDTLGGGQPVLTGPQIVTKDDADKLLAYAKRGTR